MTTESADRHLPRRNLFGVLAVHGRVRQELKRLGIKRSHSSDAPVWILVTLLAVAAASATIGAATRSLSAQTAVGLAAVVLTVAGLLVAVLQWRHGLSEKAFDALYERIALARTTRAASHASTTSCTGSSSSPRSTAWSTRCDATGSPRAERRHRRPGRTPLPGPVCRLGDVLAHG